MLWLLHRVRSISITLRVISSLLHNINFNFSGSNYIDLSLSHQTGLNYTIIKYRLATPGTMFYRHHYSQWHSTQLGQVTLCLYACIS